MFRWSGNTKLATRSFAIKLLIFSAVHNKSVGIFSGTAGADRKRVMLHPISKGPSLVGETKPCLLAELIIGSLLAGAMRCAASAGALC